MILRILKKPIYILIASLLLATPLSIFIQQPEKAYADTSWMTNWNYRQSLNYTGGTPNQTNIAMKVDLWYDGRLGTFSGSPTNTWNPYDIGVFYGSTDTDYALYANNPVIVHGGVPDSTMAKDQCIVPSADNSSLLMYYTGHAADDTHSICLAISTDGVTWTKYEHNPVFEADGSGFDAVQVARAMVHDTQVTGAKRYRMIYMATSAAPGGGGWDSLGYAYSADGFEWTRDADSWMDTGTAGEWDDLYISSPSNIMEVGATYYTYYSGYGTTTSKWQIGLITFTDFEGTITKQSSINPVFGGRPNAVKTTLTDLANGTNTVTVADTSVFEEGEPVWIKDVDSTNMMFNRISDITSSTGLEFEDNADQLYDAGSTITSWMSGSIAWTDIRYLDGFWKMTYTAFQPQGLPYDRRVTGYATSEDGETWVEDYWNSPPVPYTYNDASWDDVHSSDARVYNEDYADGEFAFLLLDGKCQTDFDDIRFASSDNAESEYDYWLEDYEAGVHATFWVEVPSVLAGTTGSIDMYYGNAAASSTSNGSAVFDFFDDFDGVALDATKWTERNSPTVSVSGSTFNITSVPAANWRSVTANATTGYGRYRSSVAMVSGGTSANAKNIWALGNTGNAGEPIVGELWGNAGDDYHRTGDAATYTDDAADAGTDGAFHTYMIDWTLNRAAFYVDDYLDVVTTTNVPTEAHNLYISYICKEDSAPAVTQTEWVFFDDDWTIDGVEWSGVGDEESVFATVETDAATNPTSSGFTLNGDIIDEGAYDVTIRGFQYGLTTSYSSNWTETGSFSTGTYSHAVSGLFGDTTYHMRAICYNAAGWSYGVDRVVRTVDADLPTVTTVDPADVTETTATLQGSLDDLGDYTTVYGFFYWDTDANVWNGTKTAEQTLTAVGGFSQAITGLTANTTYYVSAGIRYAVGGYIYGDVESFVASSLDYPTVTTGSAASVTTSAATLQGTITSLGDFSPVYVSFEYGLTTSYGYTTVEETYTSVGGFNKAISGLSPYTTYHFRAVLRYSDTGYIYGTDKTFTTYATEESEVMQIYGANIFTGYIEDGDLLCAIDLINQYTPYFPDDNSQDYFMVRLYDSDNTTILGATPLIDWGRRAVSIYLSADTASPITEGDSLLVKMVYILDEGDYAEYVLQSYDWKGNDLTYLDRWIIREAHTMELYYEETFVDYVMGKGEVLNSKGGVEMDKGISGLSYVRPDIFKVSINRNTYDEETYTNLHETTSDWETQVGTTLATLAETTGNTIGIDGRLMLTIGLVAIILLLTFVSGNFMFGILGSGAVLLTYGGYMRIVPLNVVVIIAGVFAIFVVYRMWLSRT